MIISNNSDFLVGGGLSTQKALAKISSGIRLKPRTKNSCVPRLESRGYWKSKAVMTPFIKKQICLKNTSTSAIPSKTV